MFNKSKQVLKPVNRICTGGWQKLGLVKREPDKRSLEQIKLTVDYYADKIPEIKEFLKEIKQLPKKHMGLVADTLEFSSHNDFLTNNINLRNTAGRNVCKIIVSDIIEASKNNPESLEFLEAVINNTDAPTSKYALRAMSGGILKNKDYAELFLKTAKVVPDIAEETLSGGYIGTYEKAKSFLDFLGAIINPETKADKVQPLFNDVLKFAKKRQENISIDTYKFLQSDATIEKVRENLKILPEILDMLPLKQAPFDIVSFVINNINLK